MLKIYIAYGILIATLFVVAGTRGFAVTSLMHGAKWGPQGHSQYHK